MSVPSMVHRSGDSLIVRSVVSGNPLYGTTAYDADDDEDAVSGGGEAANYLEDEEEEDVPSPASNAAPKDLPDCKVKRNYSCASCDYFTQNPRKFLYHLRDTHNEKVKIYECPNCLYASKHFQKLLRHTKMVHGTTTDGVELDPSPLPSSSSFPAIKRARKRPAPVPPVTADHEDSSSLDEVPNFNSDEEQKPQMFKCSVCSFTSRNQMQLSRHEREEHIKTKFFRCTKCSYVTHIRARFTKHVKYHSMPMIKCDMCDFRTPYKWNLDRHCKNHNGKGAFKCSACNFTADIKQSLTVHEMNHHVPPVGQAAGLGVGRRRNKVGASDATAAEDAAHHQAPHSILQAELIKSECDSGDDLQVKKSKTKKTTSGNVHFSNSDFIHPDDILHHSNGKVYFKNKCKLCNYKTAWDSEMAKHEHKVHNIKREDTPSPPLCSNVKTTKTLLPRTIKQEPTMSEEAINDICSKSRNSSLRDMASLFSSEDVFKTQLSTPLPTSYFASTKKNSSFFDKLNDKLAPLSSDNLMCPKCGHESKCLTEKSKHVSQCGVPEGSKIPSHAIGIYKRNSSRCQFCRQRCKSSIDLENHELVCDKNPKMELDAAIPEPLQIAAEDMDVDKRHPMENKVFVWNDIQVPVKEEMDLANYEYMDDKQDDNTSLDLSIRTQSPGGASDNSYLGLDYNPIASNPRQSPATDKVPTHGNDISIAQHKRVFKCPHCTFWASTASRFHVHIVGHLNKKPFECSLCSYRSNWRWDITKHIKLKSVRDPAHEEAKVLMTDETGRRNYTKYNKYLTEIPVTGDQSMETSGGSGTRPKSHSSPNSKHDLPKLTRALPSGEFTSHLDAALRPPPPLKTGGESLFAKVGGKRRDNDNKRTHFKCKKCNFRDPSREVLLQHVRSHYESVQPQVHHSMSTSLLSILSGGGATVAAAPPVPAHSAVTPEIRGTSPDRDEASVINSATAKGQTAPFRCGHCYQVSNWKHVIQRHCRLKHNGDIRVVSNKNGQERIEVEEQTDEPDHIDLPQDGQYKCKECPFSCDIPGDLERHLPGHVQTDSQFKCYYCKYFTDQRADILEHFKLHGIDDPEDFLQKLPERSFDGADAGKRFRCILCPYITNNRSQFTYHKQFHKPRNAPHRCSECSYNVTKKHLLNQHLKVHGIGVSDGRLSPNLLSNDMEEIEEVQSFEGMQDIPFVWVDKNDKFHKMFKCRFCPHVNVRKVNIQEHEKMHSQREKNPNAVKGSEVEHRCTECTYICNNAGVLSSHSKVHQGQYGIVRGLVDTTRSDEDQITEMSLDHKMDDDISEVEPSAGELFFCAKCPARFLHENEYDIHFTLHLKNLPHKCDYCSYTANQKTHLSAHSIVHTTNYQNRTKELLESNSMSQKYSQPKVLALHEAGLVIWVVNLEDEFTNENNNLLAPKARSLNVPLSGTDLFLQKSEAEKEFALQPSTTQIKSTDPQFGVQMHGNPKFVYQTYWKNGREKQKRYKCHKCPSAFEKRDQYKNHLNLHGSKQKYNCQDCDYSVKYYANYVQHMRKHAAQAQYSPEASELAEELVIDEDLPEEKEAGQYTCTNCPYSSHRKDAVENHKKRHSSISGAKSTYCCEHCDYSVPQVHFLRDHTKLHFLPKPANLDGYMACDDIKLTCSPSNSSSSNSSSVIFETTSTGFEPSLDLEVAEKFNNNEGEKKFVDLKTGESVQPAINQSTSCDI